MDATVGLLSLLTTAVVVVVTYAGVRGPMRRSGA